MSTGIGAQLLAAAREASGVDESVIFDTVNDFGALIAVVSAVVGFFFLGGRRWRGNYDAEHVKAERQHVTIVERDATIEELHQVMEGMSARLKRLDEERQEFVGSKAYEAILEQSAELRRLNDTLAELSAYLTRDQGGC